MKDKNLHPRVYSRQSTNATTATELCGFWRRGSGSMGDKFSGRWGPVFLSELRSIEVRSLSSGARDLWVALAARTRSASVSQSTVKGFYVSSAALAEDLARPNKDGTLRPITVRTVGRYLKELKEAGLVKVSRNTGPPYMALLVPPSLSPVEKHGKTSGKPVEKRPSNVRSIRQISGSDRTPIDVRCSDPQINSQIHTSRGDDSKIKKMSEMLSILHRVGNTPTANDDYVEMGCESWAQVCLVAPQGLRPMFRKMVGDLPNDEYDRLLREAGEMACEQLHSKKKGKVGN